MLKDLLKASVAASILSWLGADASAAAPNGIWYDHTGRGAVEIRSCGGTLCGRIVWLKSTANDKACGLKVIGNVRPVRGGQWDHGWILDPDNGSRYKVEITILSGSRLKILGYAGSKYLSQTMIWRKAPRSIKRCARS